MDRSNSPAPEVASLEAIARDLLDPFFRNIIHDIASEVHREEKVLRMQSVVVLAEETARAQMPEPTTAPPKGAPPPTPTVRIETVGALYDNGKTFLKGNPLQTTSEVVCPQCRLPRLLYPITGKNSRDPDLTKEYCMNYPYVSKSGHDIYGNPFAAEQAKTKKERELIKQQERTAKDNTPGSNDTGEPGEKDNYKLNMGSKPASYIPWHTCPNCKRSLLITRFAQHLEKCLGISSRASSRHAMAKLTGTNGNTPLASRTGTPQPSSQPNGKPSPTKKADDDEEDDKETPVKKKKKSSYIKKADRQRMEAEAATGAAGSGTSTPKSTSQQSQNLKLKLGSKRPPKADKDEKEGTPGVKRDREDDADDAPRKKKQKLARTDSIRTDGDEESGSENE